MPVLANRARMTTTTTGTGTITLGSAVAAFQSFADAGVTDGDVVSYVIEDGSAWEIGTGTYTASGTTLSRTVLESSNADAAISLSGSAQVYITAVAEDLPTLSQTEVVGAWLIEAVADGDYRVRLNVGYAFTITKVTTRAGAGTCTLTAKINTTALGGTANSVSTTEQAQTHSSANAVAVGDDIVLTVSANSACTDMTVEIEGTRTLGAN